MHKNAKGNTKFLPKGLEILFEDRDIILVNKPSGLLTISTEREKSKTAYAALTDYVKKGSLESRNRIYIVHRLDRDTSGILVFAKTEDAKEQLQENWEQIQKKYIAVTHGHWEKSEGKISSYLAENKELIVYSTKDKTVGKLSHTSYKVLNTSKFYSLVEIDLLTGRKNQIRVHFADEDHPVVGDTKYGEENKKYMRLALHAFSIRFQHPYSGKEMYFEAEIPTFLTDLVPLKE